MKITIIGWYGTETIGDRAILAGLISFFKTSFEKFEISIGSLYPFFTQRTIEEDYAFWKDIVQNDVKISMFDSKRYKELDSTILSSDLVVIGGGPLMHLDELVMLEYAFIKARKNNIKTAILGSGIGPIFKHRRFRKYLLNIVKYSDLIILRDNRSKLNLIEIADEFKIKLNIDDIYVGYDPAVECAVQFNKLYQKKDSDYIAVNLRSFPSEYAKEDIAQSVNKKLKNFVNMLSNRYLDKEIRLIPMHYFHIGGDDREFLNEIKFELNKENIYIQNKNLSLVQTMQEYQNSLFCIGMRFHSVVLQTIVNGKNYVLDYTEPKKGKIYGFIKDIDKNNFYHDKYIQLQDKNLDLDKVNFVNFDKVNLDNDNFIKNRKLYVSKIQGLMK
jgi:polysaccharide pyruvyl transferase WcaK-like protein